MSSISLTPNEIAATEAILTRMAAIITSREEKRCCPNCYHWDQTAEVCRKWGARPPARTIADGCEAFAVGPF